MLGVLVRMAVLGAALAAALESAAIAGRSGGTGWLTLPNVTMLASGCVAVLCGSLTAGTVGASVAVARDVDRLRVNVQPCVAPRDLTSLDDRVRAVGGSVSLDGGRVMVELPCVS